MVTDYMDELIDIVNDQDHVVRTMWRLEAEAEDVKYRRCVLIFLRNEQQGTFAVLRRTNDKSYMPGYLSIIGGGVQSGESYYQACIRETQEEANIDITAFRHRPLGLVTPYTWQGSLFKMVYEVTLSQADIVRFNTQDFSELHWLTPAQIQHVQKQDTVVPDLLWLIRSFYSITI